MVDFRVIAYRTGENDYPLVDVKETGENIRRICKIRGITVKKIQVYMSFACPQTIYRWFSGKSLPSVDNLYALSRLLGVSVDDILIGVRANRCIYFDFHCDKKRFNKAFFCYAGIV